MFAFLLPLHFAYFRFILPKNGNLTTFSVETMVLCACTTGSSEVQRVEDDVPSCLFLPLNPIQFRLNIKHVISRIFFFLVGTVLFVVEYSSGDIFLCNSRRTFLLLTTREMHQLASKLVFKI